MAKKSGRFSKEKGKRGEREAAKVLSKVLGCHARRGVQYQGGSDSPDVTHSIDGLHIEVKRTERLSLHEALAQAENDALPGHAPMVLHRRNMTPWVVIIDLTSVPKLIECLVSHMMSQPGGPPKWLADLVARHQSCATDSHARELPTQGAIDETQE